MERSHSARRWCTAATTAALDPRRGWAEADGTRRGFALGLVPTLSAWVLVAVWGGDGAPAVVGLQLLPVFMVPMASEAARVLRPYRSRRRPAEARVRHGFAAIGTALGVPVLLAVGVGLGLEREAPLLLVLVFGLVPLALLVLTVPWGVVSALARGRRGGPAA